MKLGELIKNPKGFKVAGIYRVSRFEVKTAKNGKAYGDCLISDQNCDVPAKFWDIPGDIVTLFQGNGLLRIEATLDYFKENPQLTIDGVKIPSQQDIDQSLQSLGLLAPQGLDSMYVRFKDIIAGVEQPVLRQLLANIFVENKEFAAKFIRHPGAVKNHHAYIGGLLQHSLEVAESALAYCNHNARINKDLLVSAALIHDIGKVREIEVDALGLPVGFTKEGKLLRHISLGIEIIDTACREIGAANELNLILKHCILSHHGMPEWGSPVEPMILEAEILHYLDNLSAKTEQFAREEDKVEPGEFSKSYLLRRDVYRANF